MPRVNNLISKFETIARQEPSAPPSTQRVRVTRYSMPLRQSTLNFGKSPGLAIPPRRKSMLGAIKSIESVLAPAPAPTPPPAAEDEVDEDTIVVDMSDVIRHHHAHVSLPTPSESATDVSGQSSSSPEIKSPPRSRSKRRVSSARKSAARETLRPRRPSTARGAKEEKQRNISGETLVEGAANMSQTSLLKDSIDALDLRWNMSSVFEKDGKHKNEGKTLDEYEHESSTISVPDEVDTVVEEKREAKRVKIEENKQKWEQKKADVEKNATRRSSRASLLVTKATEVVSGITSTVLGKRQATLSTTAQSRPSTAKQFDQPTPKNARVNTAEPTSIPAGDNTSLAATCRTVRSRAPKDKKWLLSGLYAGQTRSFDPTKTEAKNKRYKSTIAKTHNLATQDPTLLAREDTVLPLPMFAGARLLESGRDFKLPFDIFSPLPAGQPKPDEWRRVNKNVFVGDAADHWRYLVHSEHSTCLCKPSTGCDEDCMNRYMYYECDSTNCRLTGEQCGNRAFEELKQRVKKGGKYNVGVEVIKTAGRGYGVRSNRSFEPNQIIVEYSGEIITQEDCESRMHSIYKNNECYYLMAFDQNMIIDATSRGSIARFVNHSCAPNCRMEKWTVSGKPRMALFAGERGIMTGEELTYDYNFDPYSQKNVQVCRCGSENCRGVLGPKPKDLPKKEKEGVVNGVKRKIGEVLEEAGELLNKKRKVIEKPRLPKGWAYIEEPKKPTKAAKIETEDTDIMKTDGGLTRQPSKLKKMLSTKSKASRKSLTISTTSRKSRPSTAKSRVVRISSVAA